MFIYIKINLLYLFLNFGLIEDLGATNRYAFFLIFLETKKKPFKFNNTNLKTFEEHGSIYFMGVYNNYV